MLPTIELAVHNVLDNLTYLPLLFEVAEDLFQQDKKEAAAILYTSVAESEKYQHSERLAVCQYRLFKIALSDNKDTNLQAAVRFEPYVDRLDDADQLDALKDLANLYSSLRRWDKVNQYACEMGHKAKLLYQLKHDNKKNNKFFKEPSKPLFGYVLYSYLIQGAVCEKKRDYRQGLKFVEQYEDTRWVLEEDEEAEQTKKQFQIWALGNKYLYQLLDGNTSILLQYIDYLTIHKNELFPSLYMITRAALQYDLDIDELIESFEEQIKNYIDGTHQVLNYTDQIMKDRFSYFLTDLAYYYLRKSSFQKGFQYILNSLSLALDINNESCVTRGVGLFEEYKSQTTEEFLIKYKKIKKHLFY